MRLKTSQSNGRVNLSGGILDTVEDFTMFGGTFNFNGGTVNGAVILASDIEHWPRVNRGRELRGDNLFATSIPTTLSGILAPAQTLWVRGQNDGRNASVTIQGNATNQGTIKLESIEGTWNANLSVSSGNTLVNQGTLQINAGSGGGRQIDGRITNTGRIALGNGQRTILNNVALAQTAGVIDVPSDSAFEMQGGTFNFNGGTVNGAVILASATLNVGPGSTGAANFVAITWPATSIPTTLSGILAPAQTLWVRGQNDGRSAGVTIQGNATNQGTIKLESIEGTWNANLSVSSGNTLVNQGTLQINAGSGGGRQIDGRITNTGRIALGNGQRTILNNVALAQTAGVIDVPSDSAFEMQGGTFNFNGGTVNGAVILASATLNVGPGSTGAANFVAITWPATSIPTTLSGNSGSGANAMGAWTKRREKRQRDDSGQRDQPRDDQTGIH